MTRIQKGKNRKYKIQNINKNYVSRKIYRNTQKNSGFAGMQVIHLSI